MHITLDTQEFKNALDVVARVSTKHITLPVLQCVLLEATKDTLFFKSTNLEIHIEVEIPIKNTTPGTIAVPAVTLLQIINLINQKTISISIEGENLVIESQNSKTEIRSLPPEDFPKIPKIEEKPKKIKGSQFALGIKTTAFTASQSSIKPELGSVYIYQKKENTLTFVATDSFRLMEKTVAQPHVVLDHHLLIPFKNALEMARVAEMSDEIDLYVTENQCALRVKNIYITTRLINGTFPDYEQIIPKEYVSHATIHTVDFINSLKKTNIFLNKFLQVSLILSGKYLTLSSQNTESGSTTESIHAAIEGQEITLNFNQRYLSEITQYLTDESVCFHCAGIGRPMVIENLHDRSLRYLVMPMNK